MCELPGGGGGVQRDGALPAGDRAPPRGLRGVEATLGAAEQRADEGDRLSGGLGRGGVAASGVADERLGVGVVDFDDVQGGVVGHGAKVLGLAGGGRPGRGGPGGP